MAVLNTASWATVSGARSGLGLCMKKKEGQGFAVVEALKLTKKWTYGVVTPMPTGLRDDDCGGEPKRVEDRRTELVTFLSVALWVERDIGYFSL